MIGILTFFVPLVTTDPAVLNKTRWSVFDIVQHVWDKELPPVPGWQLAVVHFPIDCVLLYMSLLSVLVLQRFPWLQSKLLVIAVLGIYLNGAMWQWQKDNFEITFYGHVSYHNMSAVRHVGFGQLVLVQLAIWGALLFIATNEELDAESAVKA